MKFIFNQYIVLSIFALLIIGAKTSAQNDEIKHLLQSLQKQYAPDLRIVVYNISYRETKDGIVIVGEVGDPAVKDAVIKELGKKVKGKVLDSIRVLPGSELGGSTSGIVLCDVADMRCKPAKQEELVTQALMGTIVKVLKKKNGYYYIQTPDHYLGWINATNIYITDLTGANKWNNEHKVIVTAFKCTVWKKPEISSGVLCYAVMGCVLKSDKTKDGWTSVELANGHKGFVLDSVVQDLDEWNKSRQLTGDNLEKTATSLLGIPYLWGGTSVRGMDCSGFVKIVFKMNGRELQRDTYQQAEEGMHIEPGKNFENLCKGDLLFFCGKDIVKQPKYIKHVGLYLGDKLFIHSSGNVHYSSLDPASKYYDRSLFKRFVCARRLF